ncbi:hypothetical protein SAMN06265337_2307 [Hymenobacter gelipurpurascens]|uniref:Uncharacterized protein n=1 Tax=Hymenobacter gelipurpurascens TaxID=89968 RepID=A0A212TQY2_9BACT|nr:hypothetical protein [Hymenobacter gelipurpurascens]SNC68423.1 hypothetical protein SAMN06265337_2307 [Hymenobacter gelipurpurascens]
MKTLPALLLGMLLAYSFAGHSQALAPAPVAPRVFTHADTLEGLHRVFLKNRRRGRTMTALAPIAVGTTVYGWSQIPMGSTNLLTSS